MEKGDLSHKTGRKIRPTREVSVAFHMTLNEEEGIAFEKERERLGLATKAALGRMLIRQGLGLAV
ncbi:hypothetical protein Q7378_06735 [Glaesserella parasuis]|uniref:Uncharacterized protein n=2 Tax=Glaesserella parasuis TaxID=738 RepID=A0A084EX53_GLAPU|nr:hypothetical protein [Glaesserella parasuis]EPZ99345.1 hypothetical protein HPSMNH_1439 [Glaesserella parasuis MN-H]EQA14221.1 hypothetical protein HPSH465_0208 [Glaesserella parasuis H465]AMW17518.1 hypothetical protein A4U84_10140 [Glaesserella parasuis]KDB46216.1 hypothetical protein HPS10_08275 [Glaesserella parasuis HPS10]KEZ22545.1 hypothetical protein HS327_01117 [Glaesserella parasuis]